MFAFLYMGVNVSVAVSSVRASHLRDCPGPSALLDWRDEGFSAFRCAVLRPASQKRVGDAVSGRIARAMSYPDPITPASGAH